MEKVAKNPVEKIASNPVTSVAVMVFSAPKSGFEHHVPCESPSISRDFYAIRPLILWHILGAHFLLILGGGGCAK